LGNPFKLSFTEGSIHDSKEAIPLFEKISSEVDMTRSTILGDKAFGTKDFREFIEAKGAAYCIPPKSNSADPWECDYFHYKERHLVECFFNKLKHFRHVATRYDKLLSSFKSFVFLASCIILCK
jgi:transposase